MLFNCSPWLLLLLFTHFLLLLTLSQRAAWGHSFTMCHAETRCEACPADQARRRLVGVLKRLLRSWGRFLCPLDLVNVARPACSVNAPLRSCTSQPLGLPLFSALVDRLRRWSLGRRLPGIAVQAHRRCVGAAEAMEAAVTAGVANTAFCADFRSESDTNGKYSKSLCSV